MMTLPEYLEFLASRIRLAQERNDNEEIARLLDLAADTCKGKVAEYRLAKMQHERPDDGGGEGAPPKTG